MRVLALSAVLAASVIPQIGPALATSGSPPPATSTPAPAPAEPTPPPNTAPAPAPSAGAATTPSAPATATQPPVAAPVPPVIPTRQMSVSALKEKDLTGTNSGELGDIDSVVERNTDKKQFLVISRGGFLGLFETDVAVPLENVAVRNDQVLAQNLTEEQLKALPKFENDNNGYRVLGDDQSITLTEAK